MFWFSCKISPILLDSMAYISLKSHENPPAIFRSYLANNHTNKDKRVSKQYPHQSGRKKLKLMIKILNSYKESLSAQFVKDNKNVNNENL